MPNLYSYVFDTNIGIDPMGLAGFVTAILTVNGVDYIAKSKETLLKNGPFKDLVQSITDDLALKNLKEDFHGNCAEIRAIRDALDDGFSLAQLKGSQVKAFITKTGEIKKACDCCKAVLDALDIEEVRCPK